MGGASLSMHGNSRRISSRADAHVEAFVGGRFRQSMVKLIAGMVAGAALLGCGRIGFEQTDRPTDGSASDAARPLDATATDAATDASDGLPFSFTAFDLPPGGAGEAIAAPDGPFSRLYALFANRGSFTSEDGGATWTECAPGTGPAIAAAPTDPYVVYLGTGDDVLESRDGCATWTSTALGLRGNAIVALADGRVLAGSSDGVYLRAATGAWRRLSSPFDGLWITALAATRDGTVLYAGSDGSGVARSEDGGVSWELATSGLVTQRASTLALDPSQPSRVFLAESGGPADPTGALWRSADGGRTWVSTFTVGGQAIALHPTDPDVVLYAPFGSLRLSTDGGMSFGGLDRRAGEMGVISVHDLLYESTGSGRALAITRLGVFLASDQNFAWQNRTAGVQAWRIWDITTSARGEIYAGSDAGVLRSADAGATWSLARSGMLNNPEVHALLTVEGDPGLLLVGGAGLWLSRNLGIDFERVYDPVAPDGFDVNALATVAGRVYAGTDTRLIFADPPYTSWTIRSIAGANRRVHDLLDVRDGPDEPAELLIATETGTFYTDDDAATLIDVGVPQEVERLVRLRDGRILAGTDTGLLSATVPTGPWAPAGLEGHAIRSVVEDGDRIVVATDDGLWVSADGGTTYLPAGLTGRNTQSLAVSAGGILVGTLGYGIFRAEAR